MKPNGIRVGPDYILKKKYQHESSFDVAVLCYVFPLNEALLTEIIS